MGGSSSREQHDYTTTEVTAMALTDRKETKNETLAFEAADSEALQLQLVAADIMVPPSTLQAMSCADPYEAVVVQETVLAVGPCVLRVAHVSSRAVGGAIEATVRVRETVAMVDARSRVIHNSVLHKDGSFCYHHKNVLANNARALTEGEVATLRAELEA